jgi:polysaccharide deacetylase family protein (PEP-CTERM system associated)
MATVRDEADVHKDVGILTIDVEEWFHAHNYAAKVASSTWEGIPRRAEEGVDRLLEMCEELGIRATFFVLGWLAERAPALVRRIADAGHEVGCHSYDHPVIYQIGREAFRADTVHARDAIAAAIGHAPTLYRAPSFTIVPRSYWALSVLREEGFRVDSSIFPVRHPRYGNPRGPRDPFRLGRGREGLLVMPMTTLRLFGSNFAFSGGGYFRLLPLALVRASARRVNARQREPVIYYFHPWELDRFTPDVDLGWLQNVRSQGGKKDLYDKLRRALADHRVITLGEWAARVRPQAPVLEDVGAIPS